MSGGEEVVRDRRASVRLPARFPVELSDHYYRWNADGAELSPEGCAVLAGELPFKAGKELVVNFPVAWGGPALELWGEVAHVTRGMIGIRLDVSKTEAFEAMLDRVDRLQLQRPELGVLSARSIRTLTPKSVLVPTGGVAIDDDERHFLKLVGAGRSLGDVARALGEEWESTRHVPFALLHRGVLRLEGAPRHEGESPSAAAAAVRVNVRPPQAERYVASAREQLAAGDLRQAALNLRLAQALAPNDSEVAALLEKIESESK